MNFCRTIGLLQTGMEVSHGNKHSQTRSYSSLGVIFMGVGIAKVDQETIPKELSNVTVIALNHLRTGGLVCTDHIAPVFRVELRGEFGGVHQITEHHGELATLSLRYGRHRGR
jgi:hypothetical protein